MKPVDTWQRRLARMDHSRGTSNRMIREAMLAEIDDLRAALREAEGERGITVLYKQLVRTKYLLKLARERANLWRGHAKRYQKTLANTLAKHGKP